ncbi:aldo/keto reductase [bacterium]|nr:aldo/keto reductase [bacterium]
MKYRELGKTGMQVSAVAMGCWALVGDETWGPQDKEAGIQAIEHALELGINFFDTAEGYGNGYSEELLGQTLGSRRNDVFIATKVSGGHLVYDDVMTACENSLHRLQRNYIDLYQIHWPNRKIPLTETMDALLKLKEQGKIRAIGISNFGALDVTAAVGLTEISSNQLPYNLIWRAVEYGVTDLAMDNNVGILPYSPLAQGLLTGKFASPAEVPTGRARTRFYNSETSELVRHGEKGQEEETFATLERIRKISKKTGGSMAELSLAWLLAQPAVTSVLAGARNPQQIEQNAQAADIELTPEIVAELSVATAELKKRFGANPDMWQNITTTRYR